VPGSRTKDARISSRRRARRSSSPAGQTSVNPLISPSSSLTSVRDTISEDAPSMTKPVSVRSRRPTVGTISRDCMIS
jgi:hypothetical protein